MKNSHLEVIATMNVRQGMLDEFKQQAIKIIRQTREKDIRTLRYDWYLNNDETR